MKWFKRIDSNKKSVQYDVLKMIFDDMTDDIEIILFGIDNTPRDSFYFCKKHSSISKYSTNMINSALYKLYAQGLISMKAGSDTKYICGITQRGYEFLDNYEQHKVDSKILWINRFFSLIIGLAIGIGVACFKTFFHFN